MRLLILFALLLLPVSAFAQSTPGITMWPVPQKDGSIVYVPMGTGNPPTWPSSDGRGGLTYIPNGVGSAAAKPYTPPQFAPMLTVKPGPTPRPWGIYDHIPPEMR